jgi:nicotinamidase-related amidase
MESRNLVIPAEPYDFEADFASTALLMIDFQRDFVEPGGFGEQLGNNVSLLRAAIPAAKEVLETARRRGMPVIHTREGHRPDLADCPPTKLERGHLKTGIGADGPMGRILVRGEHGHEIIPELAPIAGEPVIDKPGKGSFYATDLDTILHNRGIKSLIICGVTTEVCVNTTAREANDRGYECLIVSDAVASYFPEFQKSALEMIKAQGGIVGWVAPSSAVLPALNSVREAAAV